MNEASLSSISVSRIYITAIIRHPDAVPNRPRRTGGVRHLLVSHPYIIREQLDFSLDHFGTRALRRITDDPLVLQVIPVNQWDGV